MRINPILRTDSYKTSHFLQYPEGTDAYFGYIEARKPSKSNELRTEALFLDLLRRHKWKKEMTDSDVDSLVSNFRKSEYHFKEAVFFGLQMFVKEYLTIPFTDQDIDHAEKFVQKHGLIFNRTGWEYILDEYDGLMPVTIKAPKEGTVIPEGNVLCTIESEGKDNFWVAPYIESSLLRAIWYPTTVCTISRELKKIVYKYMLMTSDNPEEGMPFKVHNFGDRGVSSLESSYLGDAGHLVNFSGTDDMSGVYATEQYYNCEMPGYSINASEHGTVGAWGINGEEAMFSHMIDTFGGKGKIFACVSDTYNFKNACENMWGGTLKDKIVNSGGIVVVRPDSGDPATTVLNALEIFNRKFGSVTNKKGFEVLNSIRIIHGDRINMVTAEEIYELITDEAYSADNVNLGVGGFLMQHHNRDTLRFAMKCSSVRVNGKWQDVFKSPVDDPMKKSKAGRLSLFRTKNKHKTSTEYSTQRIDENPYGENILETVYQNGKLIRNQNFDEVRKLASL